MSFNLPVKREESFVFPNGIVYEQVYQSKKYSVIV